MILQLPRTPSTKGQLSLGKPPGRLNHVLSMSRNDSFPEPIETWEVTLEVLSFAGDHDREPGPGYVLDAVAAVMPDPTIPPALPEDTVKSIWKYLGARPDRGENLSGGIIDRDRRESMPVVELLFNDALISLTWQDYTARWWVGSRDNLVCIVTIERLMGQ